MQYNTHWMLMLDNVENMYHKREITIEPNPKRNERTSKQRGFMLKNGSNDMPYWSYICIFTCINRKCNGSFVGVCLVPLLILYCCVSTHIFTTKRIYTTHTHTRNFWRYRLSISIFCSFCVLGCVLLLLLFLYLDTINSNRRNEILYLHTCTCIYHAYAY